MLLNYAVARLIVVIIAKLATEIHLISYAIPIFDNAEVTLVVKAL